MSGDFEWVGCFADKRDRAIPNYGGFVRTVDICREIAEANNHDVFGLQDWGNCWTGKSDVAFDRYGKGPANECKSPKGGSWTNMVYKKKISGEGEWAFRGCFKDNKDRTIPNYLGKVRTIGQCQDLADAKSFNTFGLRDYIDCFAGNFPAYGKLGAASDCSTWGEKWTNNVYVKSVKKAEFKYKGCFKDNEARMIPTYLGYVVSVKACQRLAIDGNFDTFSLQDYGECFAGNNPTYDKLGKETNEDNCPILGGDWSNQVY